MGLSQSLKSSYFLLLLCTLNVCTFNSEPLEKESVLFGGGFPALYVLGDSLVDSGNNNYLPTKAQANFTPYGSDFEGGIPTGRFTNGKTIADYIAMYYGLPLVPPYLGLSEEERNNISTGFNYASASCGILPQTGKAFGKCLSFNVQVNLVKTTVLTNLPKMFKTRTEIKKHMSESLFMIAIGVNDYAFFFKDDQTDAMAFADILLHKFLMQLQRLHKLGARKFLINNIKPVGCYPNMIAHTVPQGSCNDDINLATTIFNTKLRSSLARMKHLLRGTTFLYSDYFNFMLKLRGPSRNHASSNLVNSINPCCPSVYDGGITTSCTPDSASCSVPNTHLFFDPFHPTQFANLMYAIECFHERSVCSVVMD